MIGILEQNKLSNTPLSPYPLENIISEYKFEDNVLDTVGANDGVATAITYVTGGVGKSAAFNGSTSFVDCGFLPPTGNSERSFTFLFNTNSITSEQVFIEYGTSGTYTRFTLRITTNRVRFEIDGFGQNGTTNLSTNTWYHLTYTHDGTGTVAGSKVYLNGMSEITPTSNVSLNTGTSVNMVIGKDIVLGAGRFYNGEIGEVRAWDKKLTQTEVLNIATAELAGTDINP